MEDIQGIRQEIDQINKQMLALFTRRMQLSLLVGKEKLKEGKPIFDRSEEKILEWVSKNSEQDITPYALDFFRKLMEISREYQEQK